jgi:hypothetical protein
MDETDIRPTLLDLTGLRGDYQTDGRVITQIFTRDNGRSPGPAARDSLGRLGHAAVTRAR